MNAGGSNSSDEPGSPAPNALNYRQRTRATQVSHEQAVDLRKDLSPPEVVLWSHLRRRQLAGLRFRRQHPLGPFIADFYCHEARLVVEVDGADHQGSRRERDRRRDAWMDAQGLHVLRVTSCDVRRNLHGVLATIQHLGLERAAHLGG